MNTVVSFNKLVRLAAKKGLEVSKDRQGRYYLHGARPHPPESTPIDFKALPPGTRLELPPIDTNPRLVMQRVTAAEVEEYLKTHVGAHRYLKPAEVYGPIRRGEV